MYRAVFNEGHANGRAPRLPVGITGDDNLIALDGIALLSLQITRKGQKQPHEQGEARA